MHPHNINKSRKLHLYNVIIQPKPQEMNRKNYILNLKLQLLSLILITLSADKPFTLSLHLTTGFHFGNFNLPSLILTGTLALITNGTVPVCCCASNEFITPVAARVCPVRATSSTVVFL
ncbi:hypothetical protein Ccrd_012934 [Cynara cardunculus var. scolymus]|uniref:Uncharacterized protein n=1 Tax=Cynara cardunculus var. scolymus TaxID=59895 RepID=A0A103YGM1_CYNCS|nr:hypothetical protein Ccrd_012934 [Cynara cardunculus var. scolymus]